MQKSFQKQQINVMFSLKVYKCKADWKNIAIGIKKENHLKLIINNFSQLWIRLFLEFLQYILKTIS